MDTAQTTLKWEADRKQKVVLAAAVAAALPLLGAAWRIVIYRNVTTDLVKQLNFQREHGGSIIAISILQAIGFLALSYVLYYLFHAARARQKQIPAAKLVLGCIVIGPIVFATGLIVLGFNQWFEGKDFLHMAQTKEVAEKLKESGTISSISPIFLSGALASIFAVTTTSLLSMKSGLLTWFMGVLGVLVGVTAPFLLLLQLPVLTSLWLTSIIVILLERSPNGTPLAWKSGKAEEPSAIYIQAEEGST